MKLNKKSISDHKHCDEKNTISVKLQGRAGIIYTDGEKKMEIDSEMLASPQHHIMIYSGSISKWMPPYDDVVLTKDDIKAIKGNIESAFANIKILWT